MKPRERRHVQEAERGPMERRRLAFAEPRNSHGPRETGKAGRLAYKRFVPCPRQLPDQSWSPRSYLGPILLVLVTELPVNGPTIGVQPLPR